jgi:hypothetical protein
MIYYLALAHRNTNPDRVVDNLILIGTKDQTGNFHYKEFYLKQQAGWIRKPTQGNVLIKFESNSWAPWKQTWLSEDEVFATLL